MTQLDPGANNCFQVTEFLRWEPGRHVSLRIPPPRRGEWILIMGIYGVLFGLIGGYILYACFQGLAGPGSMSFLEAFLLCAAPMSIVGALHLAGGHESTGSVDIDWAKGLLVSSSPSGTSRFQLSDLKDLVLRGEYYVRPASRRKAYHARLDAQFQSASVLTGWITWRALPALSVHYAQSQLRRAVEQLGGHEFEMDSWTIGSENYGPAAGFSFEDQALADDSLLELRDALLNCERFMLNLAGTPIGDEGLQAVAGNEKLVYINLRETRVSNRAVQTLSSCPSLIELDLTRTAISDDSLAHLAHLSNLRCLRLWGTRVTDAGVQDLIKLKNLRELYLNQTGVTAEGLATLKAALPGAEIHE